MNLRNISLKSGSDPGFKETKKSAPLGALQISSRSRPLGRASGIL
jgi:hypothetical protein